jgi:glycosyltransferase involved in cell wall biosynthesis
MKVAVLTNILTPYRIPLFERLREGLEEFTVLVMARQEENRRWRLPHGRFHLSVLPGIHARLPGREAAMHFNVGVMRALRRFNPDVVINGGFAPANLAAWFYCRARDKVHIAWGHLTLRDGAHRSAARRLLRRVMIRGSAGCIGESSEAIRAFLHYGAEPDRILKLLMPFDTELFHEGTRAQRRRPGQRERRGRYRGPVVLTIGQWIARKGYGELFRMYERLLDEIAPLSWLILGEGPERGRYERMIAERGWRDVHVLGHVQSPDLPQYLALADLFVLPTRYDPYGLVVAEAMAAELPVVSSLHAAATEDLVVDGVTGFRFDPLKCDEAVATLAGALRMSPSERRAMGREAYERVRSCDPQTSAETMLGFVRSLPSASREQPVAS